MKLPDDFGIPPEALTELVVPNDLRSAKQPESRIMSDLVAHGYDSDTTFAIKLALEEAMANAVKHGNRNDPTKRIVVRYGVDAQRAVIMIRDEGCGFCPDRVPDPTLEENLERPNGRGIMLMFNYMTRVVFNKDGNEVWMLKLKPDAPP